MRLRPYRLKTVPGLMSLLLAASLGWAQDDSQEKLKTWLTAVKASMGKSRQSLRQYAWVESTEISLKGEVKSLNQNDCRYGPDGTVQKTPTSAPTEQKKKRGVRGKMVENKKEELADYMERAGSLVKRYVPPDPLSLEFGHAGWQGDLPTGAARQARFGLSRLRQT